MRSLTVETAGPFPDRYVYSDDIDYRYEFQRRWKETTDPVLDTVVWVGLNPGTGDTDGKPRRTLTRCIEWSRSWGYASLTIVNLFAYRSTNRKHLRTVNDPIGPDNDDTIRRVTANAPLIIVAWGNDGRLLGRGAIVATTLRDPRCLGITRRGQPRHPLYIPFGAALRGYEWVTTTRQPMRGRRGEGHNPAAASRLS